MGAGDDCAMGILTLQHKDPCLSVTTNQILCAFEAIFGVLLIVLLLREFRRVFALLRVIIVLHIIQTCCVISICVLSLAEVDPTIEAKYALYSLAHVFFAFAVSGRLFVLGRVVYMSAAPQRVRARAQNTWKLAAFLFGMATVQSIINVSLWMFTPLYATPGSNEYEDYHQIGFVVFGVYLTGIAIGLACVSRYVIKLYNMLQLDSDSNEARRRQKAVAILRQMTISVAFSQFAAGLLLVILGAIPGALRNEVAHIVFWLSQFALLNVVPFVRRTAEIRENHQETQRDLDRKATVTSVSRSPQTRASRGSQAEAKRMGKSPSSLSSSQTEPEPLDTRPVGPTLATATTMLDTPAPSIIDPSRDPSDPIPSDENAIAPEASSPSAQPVCFMDRLRAISVQFSRSRQSTQIEQLQQAEGAMQMEVIVETPTAQPLQEAEATEAAEAEGEAAEGEGGGEAPVSSLAVKKKGCVKF